MNRNLREWIALFLWLSSAFLLAYGVIRVPSGIRWYLQKHGLVEKSSQPRTILLFTLDAPKMNSNLESVISKFMRGLKKEPLEHVEVLRDILPSEAPDLYKVVEKRLQKKHPSMAILLLESSDTKFLLHIQAFRPSSNSVGPKRYLSRLPIHFIQKQLDSSGHQAQMVYDSKSDRVQNDLFYSLMEISSRLVPSIASGVVEVPKMRTQDEVDTASKALRIIVEASSTVISVD